MQNKGIVICVAVLLTLASIFYLSFSFATRYYDSEAAKIKDPIAQQDYKDSVKYLGVYSYHIVEYHRPRETEIRVRNRHHQVSNRSMYSWSDYYHNDGEHIRNEENQEVLF